MTQLSLYIRCVYAHKCMCVCVLSVDSGNRKDEDEVDIEHH